jgi:hypothetical protein
MTQVLLLVVIVDRITPLQLARWCRYFWLGFYVRRELKGSCVCITMLYLICAKDLQCIVYIGRRLFLGGNLAVCPIILFLALTFADEAFQGYQTDLNFGMLLSFKLAEFSLKNLYSKPQSYASTPTPSSWPRSTTCHQCSL